MMVNVSDPWRSISPPEQPINVTSNRVDPTIQWNLFWSVDIDRRCLLILQYDRMNQPKGRLPKMQGLDIEIRIPDDGAHGLLIIRLMDNEQRDIFHRLCLDIISATRIAKSEKEAIERFLGRAWRWHRLLKRGRDGRLSEEEQKGFLGELVILRHVLFPVVGVPTAIESWTGPLNAPKDFEIGRVCIEAKARRGAANPYIAISTEHQLDTSSIDALFLHVSEITAASDNDEKSVTVADVAREIREEVEKADLSSIDLLEERFAAAGFDWTDDYTDQKWLLGPRHLFEIRDNFPRVTPLMFPSGVGNVRYSISLPECEPFRSNQDHLENALSRSRT